MELKTDILVIGGGLAGCCAALRARARGAAVIAASRGKGACANVNGFQSWQDGTQQGLRLLTEDMVKIGCGLNERALLDAALKRSTGIYDALESYGIAFARDLSGEKIPKVTKTNQGSFVRGYQTNGEFGLAASRAFPEALQKNGVTQLRGVDILFPVMQTGRVIGAVGKSGDEWVLICAKAVILACGGVGKLFPTSTYPPDIRAGYVPFALLAGAELRDMEFLQYEPAVLCNLPEIGYLSLPTSLWQKGGKLVNGKGERFLQKYYGTSEKELKKDGRLDKDLIARRIAAEVFAGRGTSGGGVWYDAREVDPALLQQYSIKMKRLAVGGIDLTKTPVEIFPNAHSHMGGVAVNRDCASSVPGLYAAGESAGGFLGASRMPGFGGASAVLLGDLAGNSAAAHIALEPEIDEDEWKSAVYQAFLHTQMICGDFDLEHDSGAGEVSRILQNSFGIIKDAASLQSGLRELERVKAKKASADAIDIPSAIHTFGAVRTAEAMLSAGLMRTESRGTFFRSDFPTQTDAWSASIRFSLREDGRLQSSIWNNR